MDDKILVQEIDEEHKKTLINIQQQIEYMKSKGITFNHISEKDAMNCLKNNNYFRLSSYRKNYKLKMEGDIPKYVFLDFAYLNDLASIDMELRNLVIVMCLDIEHYAKLELLSLFELKREDAYDIVDDFIHSLSDRQYTILSKELLKSKTSIYSSGLYNHYNLQLPDINDSYSFNIPIWVFLEVISFGTLVSLYKFAAVRYNLKAMLDRHYLLKSCKSIRNASAHNNCILNELSSSNTTIKTSAIISRKISKISTISRNSRKKKLGNIRIQEITTLLLSYSMFVTSTEMKNKTNTKLSSFSKRMMENIDYYERNRLIYSTFVFLQAIIDKWIQIE